MAEKFELASEAWFREAFRLFEETAKANPEIEFSVCEVFRNVPARLGPGPDGTLAWHATIRGGRAVCSMGEVDAAAVDVKTVADWEAVLPAARYRIDFGDPEDLARYQQLTASATAEGRIIREGDVSKAPPSLFAVHNALAERTL